jgi:hypothetical protein
VQTNISCIVASFILVSCEISNEPFYNNIPYGTWIFAGSDDSLSIYYYANQFDDDKPGIAIKKENVFIERTAGWCATPPLIYFNIEGKWEVFNDNTLKITCSNWINENYGRLMEIVSLHNNELQVIFHSLPK